MWHFTPEQVDAFLRNPAVRPSILAKSNAMVYDFLAGDRKSEEEACMILDLPGRDAKEVAEFFCWSISTGPYQNIHFSFDSIGEVPRVTLKGDAKVVMELVNRYYQQ